MKISGRFLYECSNLSFGIKPALQKGFEVVGNPYKPCATGYSFQLCPQENGQRRYGGPPPGWEGPPPERGSEIFVGKLPRDLFEDELVPLCEKVRDVCRLKTVAKV